MDIDIDEETINDCQYDIFNDVHTWSTNIKTNSNSLQIIHVNIRSLRKYFSQLLVLINNCIDAIDVLILTESNVKEEYLPLFAIPNFAIHANTRLQKVGGGILIYIKESLNYSASNLKCCAMECVHMTLSINNRRTHIIAIYRPPDKSKKLFTEELDSILRNQPKKDSVILAGDCNVNIDIVECPESSRYLDVMSSHGLQRAIRSTTRAEIRMGRLVTSCIDHIFVRTGAQVELSAYTLITQLADHYLTGLTVGFEMQDESRSGVKMILCENLIRDKLDNTNWTDLLKINCPILMYENLCKIFSNTYES